MKNCIEDLKAKYTTAIMCGYGVENCMSITNRVGFGKANKEYNYEGWVFDPDLYYPGKGWDNGADI